MSEEKLSEVITNIGFLHRAAVMEFEIKEYTKAEYFIKSIHDVILKEMGDPMEAGYMTTEEKLNYHDRQDSQGPDQAQ